jgi:hypothetical protein
MFFVFVCYLTASGAGKCLPEVNPEVYRTLESCHTRIANDALFQTLLKQPLDGEGWHREIKCFEKPPQ